MRELRHPNLVRFVGTIWEPSAMLILERLDGSVREALRDQKTLNTLVVAAYVARGMEYLVRRLLRRPPAIASAACPR